MGPVSVCRIGAESADPSYLFGGEVPDSDLCGAAWLGRLPLTLLDFAGPGRALAGDRWLAAPSRGLARGTLCEAEHVEVRLSSDSPRGPHQDHPGFRRPFATAEAARFTGVFSFRGRHSIRAAQTRKVTDMSQSMAATGLLMLLGVAPAAADCLSARQALFMARYEAGAAALEETAASERYITARSEFEAARLRREREERRARYAARDRVEAREVCRHLDDDRDAVRACEGRAAAVYDRALAARR